MTQMDLLVTNVADLLATAVHEVLRLMGQAMSEYLEESSRMRLENQKLQRKVEELQQKLEISDSAQQISSSAEEPYFEKCCGPALDCSLDQVSAVTKEKDMERQKLSSDEQTLSKRELELEMQDVNTHSQPKSPACEHSGKSMEPPDNDFATQPCPLPKIKTEPSPDPTECSQSDSILNMSTHQQYSPVHGDAACITQNQHTQPHTLSPQTEYTLDASTNFSMMKESLHACHVCHKTFATSSSLGAHFVCHSNERPFSCQCCKFSFSRLADLKKHERIHTGERPYCCFVCGRRFNRMENLRRHLRKVHHGVML